MLKALQETIDRPLESFLSNKEDFLNNADEAFQEEKEQEAVGDIISPDELDGDLIEIEK